jgi:NAD(P)-dependent dehydrogenase (short-subunit alcohol dehydrogenase family)
MHVKTTKKKIALVTGANRGLGFETCKQLSELGVTVLLTSRDPTKGEVAAKRLIDKGLDVIFYQLDVSDRNNINDIFTKIENQFGRLDILINNAAILYDKDQSTMNADLELVNKALTANLFGPWLLC